MEKPNQKQIDAWKAQFGEISQINVGDKSCILRKPNRKEMSFAAASAATDPLKYNEVILKACWLAGDMEIQTNDDLFLSISPKLSELIELKEAELVKL